MLSSNVALIMAVAEMGEEGSLSLARRSSGRTIHLEYPGNSRVVQLLPGPQVLVVTLGEALSPLEAPMI